MERIEELRVDSIEYLRADSLSRPIGADRNNRVIRGVVLAQAGPFRTRRGAFNQASLQRIKQLAAVDPEGLRTNLGHPDPRTGQRKSLTYLGRTKNPYDGTVDVIRNGQRVRIDAVRADLHLNSTIFKAPPGGGTPLGEYLLGFAETDHGAMSGSLVLTADKSPQLNSRGRPLVDENGQPLPPLWDPLSLIGYDLVDLGDATESLLGCWPIATDTELTQMIARNDARRAKLSEPDAELLRMRWNWKKKKAAAASA